MGVYIKGMEMPKSCHECVAGYGGCCYVAPADADGICPDHGRAEFCPLVPVPPHGRLIDADVLVKKIGENIDKAKDRSYDWWYACTVAYDFALAAPTIIPAEEEA